MGTGSRWFRTAAIATDVDLGGDGAIVIQGFVTCQEMGTYDDGSLSAVCWSQRSNFSEGIDLGAYLIRQGLALAGPDAPFEYRALERIAQTNGLGIWGFHVEGLSPRLRRHEMW
jgi:endonuclease YncB( thermonuclease family)